MNDAIQAQRDILSYWKNKNIFNTLRKRNENNKPFSFIDGPITANNPMGVHHAWGRTLKDLYQRYKAMQGYDQRYQNGFDCQGLWLEVETEKDLGFNSKKDIENYGLEKFSTACRQRVEKFSKVQTEQSILLGQWMDWGNDYYTMSDDNIQAIWHFLKKCHEKHLLYKGKKILPWCIRCGTSSSKHEMSDEGYAELVHPSIYVKAKINGRANEYLLIWTTTEWTLSSNIAAAVNPTITYVQAQKGNDIYYISEATISKLGADAVILRKMKGADLLGIEYESFYPDFPVQKNVKHIVIPSDEVGEKDGTGIVHIAPNCGDVDYELGKKLKLHILDSALDEFGNYMLGYSWLTGRNVRDVKKEIVHELQKRGILYSVEQYKHRYPVCWRCKEELVFRLDSAWFIACDPIRPLMKRQAAKVTWYPEHVGKLMLDWLDNMEDWNISRKRYWGLPLMFYECVACKTLTIIGSLDELRQRAVQKTDVDKLPELHRPWIDAIQIKCTCGQTVARIKDVGDCWLDAGIVPYSTLHYFDNKPYWEKWFPAQLEIEMRAQVRLWFYAQLFMSVVLERATPYKKVLAYEEVRDEKGEPMHKSRGNAIWFDEAVEKMGADVMRWQYCSQNPQYNLNFGYGPAKEIQRQLLVIKNLATYIRQNCVNLAKGYSKDPASMWILSKRENLKKNVTLFLDNLEYHKAMEAIKNYFLYDLSKTYVQFIREKLHDRKVQKVLYDSYFDGLTLLAPFLPFITEEINLALYKKESIHLQLWPKAKKKFINLLLEEQVELLKQISQAAFSLRDKEKINVRWPLPKAEIYVADKNLQEKIKPIEDLLKKHINVKNLVVHIQKENLELKTEGAAFAQGEVRIDTNLTPELEQEGYARELIRRIQAKRKEIKLEKNDKIDVLIISAYSLKTWKKEIKKKVGAQKLTFAKKRPTQTHAQESTEKIRDKEFIVLFNILK